MPRLTLYYEDFLADSQAYFESIFDFLDVPYVDVRGKAMKITNDDLSKALVNYEELKSRYSGTPYGPMFSEVISPG